MRCQHGQCGHDSYAWVTRGGVTKKICAYHVPDYMKLGWVRR